MSSKADRPRCVVHEDSVPWQTLADRKEAMLDPTEQEPLREADRCAPVYNYKRRSLAQAAGGKTLGCSLMEVAPGGCTAFPYHAHALAEESVYVLSGEGLMRMPKGDFLVKAGDYVALLPGEEFAHQLWNFHATEPLRYLCMSAAADPTHDAVVYPDSGKARKQKPKPRTRSTCSSHHPTHRWLTLCLATGPRQIEIAERRHLPARRSGELPPRRG